MATYEGRLVINSSQLRIRQQLCFKSYQTNDKQLTPLRESQDRVLSSLPPDPADSNLPRSHNLKGKQNEMAYTDGSPPVSIPARSKMLVTIPARARQIFFQGGRKTHSCLSSNSAKSSLARYRSLTFG